MLCGGDQAIQTNNMTSKSKTGIVQRYRKGWFSNKWKKQHLVLHKDSMLLWYKELGDINADGYIVLKKICNFLVVGPYTANLPDRPKLPYGTTDRYLMAVPSNPSRKPAQINWFLFSDDSDLNSWMTAICNTLPPAPKPSQLPEKSGPPIMSDNPPPYAPGTRLPPLNPSAPRGPVGTNNQKGAPPIGFTGVNSSVQQNRRPDPGNRQLGTGNRQLGTGNRQPGTGNTTVVVQADRGGRGSGAGDFATGMLLGGAMGYGMGSMMHPSWGYGYGGGWGYHSGWGHYDYAPDVHVQNTTIVNNIEQNENTEINETNITNVNEQDFNEDMRQQDEMNQQEEMNQLANQQQQEQTGNQEFNDTPGTEVDQGLTDADHFGDDNMAEQESAYAENDYEAEYQDTGYTEDYQDQDYGEINDYGGGGGDDYGDFGGGDFDGGDFGFD